MRNLTELNKLEQWLVANNIHYERIDKEDIPIDEAHPYCLAQFEHHQICVPEYDCERREWDAICNRGSYGAEEGLLEIMGTIVRDDAGDSVEGWLTAEDVIERVKEKYFKKL